MLTGNATSVGQGNEPPSTFSRRRDTVRAATCNAGTRPKSRNATARLEISAGTFGRIRTSRATKPSGMSAAIAWIAQYAIKRIGQIEIRTRNAAAGTLLERADLSPAQKRAS